MSYHLIYLAHGDEIFLYETLLSIASFYSKNDNYNINICVYTDNPCFFEEKCDKRVNTIFIDKEILIKWKGEHNFIHLVKIEVLKDYCSKFSGGKYLFVDSDTFFTKNIRYLFEKISENSFVMHENEGLIKNSNRSHLKRLYKFLKNQPYDIDNCEMWNSGVIGFDSQNRNILDFILQTTEALYPQHQTHIMEQFAFAYHFQKQGTIKSTYSEIHHYWYGKKIRKTIVDFFNFYQQESFEVWVKKCEQVNPEKVLAEVYKYKFGSFITKLWIKTTTFSKGRIKKIKFV